MKYTLKIKPYGENQKGGLITDFDEEEWDLIVDLQERLIRNFKHSYPEIKFDKLVHDKKTITMIFGKDNPLNEDEIEEYVSNLCGYNMENVIFFDDEEFYIRGDIIIEEKNKLSAFDKIRDFMSKIKE